MFPMNTEAPASEAQSDVLPLKSRAMSMLLLGFCCCHAVFLIASIVPRETPSGKSANPALSLYRLLLSGGQQWNVFETIPLFHSLDVRIEVNDGEGGRKTIGSVQPGFAPYPQPEVSRYYVTFHRMLLNSKPPSFFAAYLQRTDDLLRARYGSAITGQWAMVVDVEQTRTLLYSQRDGVLYAPGTNSFDAAHPEGMSR